MGQPEARPELAEPLLELGEQGRPRAVLVGVEGGQQRRGDLELDDGTTRWTRPAGRAAVLSGSSGRGSAAGEQDVLEASVVAGEHDAPLAVKALTEHGAGVVGQDAPEAGRAARVLVEPERGGQPQTQLRRPVADPARPRFRTVDHRRERLLGEIRER
ncbi:hypothetical protein [Actinomycetospora cinnamomea]|uniref:Uncharacterized protein n=1 Tax=Actinomycetospora cinnamomea TaxID=663609 RepID=A0A2U1FR30_9PSEU|nr:hypothetical protein [Actinomycetospora cinnamomea]PVZ14594.1 hypothetical protein C8D89_101459 [Actinomycetospora cinnamomea]